MAHSRIKGSLILLLTAIIWGGGFVAQKIGVIDLGVFTFGAVRFFISGFALLPLIAFRCIRGRKETPRQERGSRRALLVGGVLCGVCLTAASAAQQTGLIYTTAGKAGFITAFYIIFVPILGLFMKKKTTVSVWLSVIVALVGFYLMCVQETHSINYGDVIVLTSAILFACHILIIDHFSPKTDGVALSFIQFFVSAAIYTVLMFIFEKPSLDAIVSSWKPLLYLGVVSGGMGYTLQIIGQQTTTPAVASMILSMEAVFAAVAGGVFLGEVLTLTEILGCLLVFSAVIWSQVATLRAARLSAQTGNTASR